MCKDIHIGTTELALKFDAALKRKVYNTPKSFLDFIKLFKKCYEEKKNELSGNLGRLQNGLTKLDQANSQVAQL